MTTRNKYWFIIIFTFLSASLSGQKPTGSELELQKQADKLYTSGNYAVAAPIYSQLLSLFPHDVLYNYRYGSSLVEAGKEKTPAIVYLEFATKNSLVPEDAWWYLGKAYMQKNNFSSASDAFVKFKSIASPAKSKKMEVDLLIANCSNANEVLKNRKDIAILNSREVKKNGFYTAYDYSETSGKLVPTADQFQSTVDKSKSKNPLMFITKDGQNIYYSSYGKGGTTGKDIYQIRKMVNGQWGIPENLGFVLNSVEDEEYPYLDRDGKTLYFSSRGHNSMGGFDLFKSVFNYNTGQWSVPENLGVPINSASDEFFFVPTMTGEQASYSTNFESNPDEVIFRNISLTGVNNRFAIISGTYFSLDQATRRDARITVIRTSDNAVVNSVRTDPKSGRYELVLPPGSDYTLLVEGGSYLAQAEQFSLPDLAVSGMRQEIKMNRDKEREQMTVSNFFTPVTVKENEKVLAFKNTATTVSVSSVSNTGEDSTQLIPVRLNDQTIYIKDPKLNDSKDETIIPAKAVNVATYGYTDVPKTGVDESEEEDLATKKGLPGIKLEEKDRYDPTLETKMDADELRQIEEEKERAQIIEEEERNPTILIDFNIDNDELAQIALDDAESLQDEAERMKERARSMKANAILSDSLSLSLNEEAESLPKEETDKKAELKTRATELKEESISLNRQASDLLLQASIKLDESRAARKDADAILISSGRGPSVASNAAKTARDVKSSPKTNDVNRREEISAHNANFATSDDIINTDKPDEQSEVLSMKSEDRDPDVQTTTDTEIANAEIADASIKSEVPISKTSETEASNSVASVSAEKAVENSNTQLSSGTEPLVTEDKEPTADAFSHKNADAGLEQQNKSTTTNATKIGGDNADEAGKSEESETEQGGDKTNPVATESFVANPSTERTTIDQKDASAISTESGLKGGSENNAESIVQSAAKPVEKIEEVSVPLTQVESSSAVDSKTDTKENPSTELAQSVEVKKASENTSVITAESDLSGIKDSEITLIVADTKSIAENTESKQTFESSSENQSNSAEAGQQSAIPASSARVERSNSTSHSQELSIAAARENLKKNIENAEADTGVQSTSSTAEQQIKSGEQTGASTLTRPDATAVNEDQNTPELVDVTPVIQQGNQTSITATEHTNAASSAINESKTTQSPALTSVQTTAAAVPIREKYILPESERAQIDPETKIVFESYERNLKSSEQLFVQSRVLQDRVLSMPKSPERDSLLQLSNAMSRESGSQYNLAQSQLEDAMQMDSALSDKLQYTKAPVIAAGQVLAEKAQQESPSSGNSGLASDARTVKSSSDNDKSNESVQLSSTDELNETSEINNSKPDGQVLSSKIAPAQQTNTSTLVKSTVANMDEPLRRADNGSADESNLAEDSNEMSELNNSAKNDAEPSIAKVEEPNLSLSSTKEESGKRSFATAPVIPKAEKMEIATKEGLDINHPKYPAYEEALENITKEQVNTINLFAEGVNLNKLSVEEKQQQVDLLDSAQKITDDNQRMELIRQAEILGQSSAKNESLSKEKFAASQKKTSEVKSITAEMEALKAEIKVDPSKESRSQLAEAVTEHNKDQNQSTGANVKSLNEKIAAGIGSDSNVESLAAAKTVNANNNVLRESKEVSVAEAISSEEVESFSIKTFSKARGPVYSELNPIPLNPGLPEGLVFKVQVGAFRKPIPDQSFKNLQPVSAETTRPGWLRYCVGMFKTFEPANYVKKELRSSGYKDAFVVAYYNGKRISLQEANALLNQQDNQLAYNGEMQKEMAILQELNVIPAVVINSSKDEDEQQFYGSSPKPSAIIEQATGPLLYSVQVGVYRTSNPPVLLNSLEPIYTEALSKGLYRFTSGRYNDRSLAESAKENAVSLGVSDAFVVAVRGTKNVSMPPVERNPAAPSKEIVSVQSSDPIKEQTGSETAIKPANAETGLHFKVQLGAFKQNVPFETVEVFLKISDKGIVRVTDERGLNIFYAGDFSDLESARLLKEEIVAKGVKDAFVVVLSNGKKVPLSSVLKIEE